MVRTKHWRSNVFAVVGRESGWKADPGYRSSAEAGGNALLFGRAVFVILFHYPVQHSEQLHRFREKRIGSLGTFHGSPVSKNVQQG